ncbi:hypothetical protein CANARDRAFT_27725 [[Candida] arabinofermentans NRRL YB-2248]|uniref:Uncharacterized protein n=1 Tax=[Candida] arabinofermentans NRRL YB-2248 TaxID=983967 RepID=A0A1E4T468_9ASCO|nr:hypothetical protein CANARDRAFT_27725 [[Candida] arabinofermentans NRRL YB-2248]
MDMDKEFEEFQKTNQSSLIGFSLRNSGVSGIDKDVEDVSSGTGADSGVASGSTSKYASRATSSSRPMIKTNPSTSNVDYVSVETLKAEGGLLNDEDSEYLDTVMDEEGHLKNDALQVTELATEDESKTTTKKSSPLKNLVSSIDEFKEKDEIFGGDHGKYVAPAAAMSKEYSDFKYDSPHLKTPKVEEKEPELYKAQELTTVDDILKKINDGNTEVDEEEEKESDQKNNTKKKIDISVSEPQIPDSVIELDSQFTAPASMREGSVSQLAKEQIRSRSRSTGRSPFREGTGTYKPHLARGESYHSGLSNDDYNSTAPLDFGASESKTESSSTSTAEFERRPRHEPGAPRITNASSLKYLRDISRSRSRAAIERASSVPRKEKPSEEAELKNEGALMDDSSFSQMPDLDDAISNALKLVEGTRTVSEGSKLGVNDKEDIVKHLQQGLSLDDVKEEEEGAEEEKKDAEPVKEESIEEDAKEVFKEETFEDAPAEETVTGDSPVEEEVAPKEEEVEEEVAPKEEEVAPKEEEVVHTGEREFNLKKTSEPEQEQEPKAEPKVEPESESVTKKVVEEEEDFEKLIADAQKEQDGKTNSKSIENGGGVYVPKASKMTFEDEPVYIYTSLAGGFQIMTRTNRLQTIMAANKITVEFKDLGTDEEAKKVWRRYSGGKSLPGVVRGTDDFIGNWEDIEEANENYEVRSLIYESY